MRYEYPLAGAIAVLALTMVAGATAVPGVFADAQEDVRPSELSVQQPYIDATDIGGESVTLSLSSRLEHRGGTAGNVTLVTRAIDTETGLVETTDRQSLGTIDDDRDVPYTTNLSVERDGNYRIETEVYADDRLATTHTGTVSNLDALVPTEARSPVQFHEFDRGDSSLEPITYRIVEARDDESTLNVTAFLTNIGDDTAGGVDLQLRARQADSNVIADAATISVGEIRPGRTRTVSTEITVPDGYDYWLDGILASDDVIIATESSVADLDPTETVATNRTRTETGFDSGDFAERTEAPAEMDGREGAQDEGYTTGASGPGFTAGATVLALLLATLLVIRRQS